MKLVCISGFSMAKLKKICDSTFETDKEVIICGKGASLSRIHEIDLKDKLICCLNSATLFVDKVDYLIITDMPRLKFLLEKEQNFEKIKNIIIPIQLHEFQRASEHTYLDALRLLGDKDVNVYTFHLNTQKIEDPETDQIDKIKFGPEMIMSTFHVALFWLTHVGFGKFKIFGVSKNSAYQEMFNKLGDVHSKGKNGEIILAPSSWFESNYNNGVKILDRQGIEYEFFNL